MPFRHFCLHRAIHKFGQGAGRAFHVIVAIGRGLDLDDVALLGTIVVEKVGNELIVIHFVIVPKGVGRRGQLANVVAVDIKRSHEVVRSLGVFVIIKEEVALADIGFYGFVGSHNAVDDQLRVGLLAIEFDLLLAGGKEYCADC